MTTTDHYCNLLKPVGRFDIKNHQNHKYKTILNLGAHFLSQICKRISHYKMNDVYYSIKSVICLSINDNVNT